MKKLLAKELLLAVPPGIYLFSLLAALMVIPNYPIVVSVGYCFLAVFIALNTAKLNKDIEFSAMLPVSRKEIVKSKMAVVLFLQLLQLVMSVPFAVIANLLISPQGTFLGLDPNPAFYGVMLLAFAAANLVFFPWFFKNGLRLGYPLLAALLAFLTVYLAAELAIQFVPQLAASLDTLDPARMGWQCLALGVGAVCYALTLIPAYRLSVRKFEAVSL